MIGDTTRGLSGLVAALLVSACGSAPATSDGPERPQPVGQQGDEALPPPGYGTLREDNFTVSLQSGQVQVKVTPLAESVIRLAAPDTYQRLHRLVESRSERIRQLAQRNGLREDPLVMQVSFFTRDVQSAFEPTNLTVLSEGIQYRPIAILPITPDWGREQLKQQEVQRALYLFNPGINLEVAFQVDYRGTISRGWGNIIPTLEAERGRVLSRARR
ncbi:MAG: hypothetical protein GWN99_18960 [Gemmatimonadetes bacterium]|uniref:Lipoprotein n=1 Tax=Candidatus Kutchimonas denitrificans TaxID=3056748 RepID=A0AAE4Z4R9_9BACT|nr:hypothetical protein [Gemmatimonadota bacterium]NIR73745.1 hypothetical protein [Candidatus Kutchimonas denitrificans]NIS03109.1 hypothetical protein [Gemmatimonadota bacterium]NIT69010.1 hypothetical protein [Gemmatimonadota bacterium]NIU54101.1 hypothetical protein [Gemmatimonadota bacterium]